MKILTNAFLLLLSPVKGWQSIAENVGGVVSLLLGHTVPFALIPAACWYYGVTAQGWSIAGDSMRLTPESALPMCIMFFLAMVAGVVFLAFMVWWMSTTYGTKSTFNRSLALITYTATPFFVAGLLGLYPLLWLDISVGTLVAGYCIYLLYIGVAPVMQVRQESGFLYASAVFAVSLVAFVGLLTGTVLLWDFGPAPEYTY